VARLPMVKMDKSKRAEGSGILRSLDAHRARRGYLMLARGVQRGGESAGVEIGNSMVDISQEEELKIRGVEERKRICRRLRSCRRDCDAVPSAKMCAISVQFDYVN
jgi:hypothetical protein